MTLEQAKELECNRWMLVHDEATLAGVNLWEPKYKHLKNALVCWGESLAEVRMRGTAEERMHAAAEASNRYITEKRV